MRTERKANHERRYRTLQKHIGSIPFRIRNDGCCLFDKGDCQGSDQDKGDIFPLAYRHSSAMPSRNAGKSRARGRAVPQNDPSQAAVEQQATQGIAWTTGRMMLSVIHLPITLLSPEKAETTHKIAVAEPQTTSFLKKRSASSNPLIYGWLPLVWIIGSAIVLVLTLKESIILACVSERTAIRSQMRKSLISSRNTKRQIVYGEISRFQYVRPYRCHWHLAYLHLIYSCPCI
jgi:hypothetical protein